MNGVAPPGLARVVAGDIPKLAAFSRRDVLVMWSYRLSFVSDWLSLLGQVLVFYFVGQLVDVNRLPHFGGRPTTYVEFVAIGVAFASFVQVSLARVSGVMRQEQLMGTLESLLVTPTAPAMIQVGSVAFDLVYVPLRTGVFLTLVSVLFGVGFAATALLPAAAVMVCFIPFVWGVGIFNAAAILTLRRTSAVTALAGSLLTLGSGAYFPVEVLPGWLQWLAELNPITVALRATRELLLGGASWASILPDLAVLVPTGILSLLVGTHTFRLAVRRETRRGTLGLY